MQCHAFISNTFLINCKLFPRFFSSFFFFGSLKVWVWCEKDLTWHIRWGEGIILEVVLEVVITEHVVTDVSGVNIVGQSKMGMGGFLLGANVSIWWNTIIMILMSINTPSILHLVSSILVLVELIMCIS